MNKRAVGLIGESAVADWLQERGWNILNRNFTIRGGEIDIVAENGQFIAFVEVKSRQYGSSVWGREAVNSSKQKRLIRAAMFYLTSFPTTFQPRFDVAEVELKGEAVVGISYMPNAYDCGSGMDSGF